MTAATTSSIVSCKLSSSQDGGLVAKIAKKLQHRRNYLIIGNNQSKLSSTGFTIRTNRSPQNVNVSSATFNNNNNYVSIINEESLASTSTSTSYTSMRDDPLHFWDNHKGLNKLNNQHDNEEQFLYANLRLLAAVAADRAETHAILGQQRDNWNKLFQSTLTAASFTACILAAYNGAAPATSAALAAPAALISAVSAAMMSLINTFQPSQLAEEQRTATRLFRKLAADIDYALSISAELRQPLRTILRDSRRRLRALDKAFPMPLTPGGLEKFPAEVRPPVLIEPLRRESSSSSTSHEKIDGSNIATASREINGWDERTASQLLNAANLLKSSDEQTYIRWCTNLVKVNKCFAIAAPAFAASAALLNSLGFTFLSSHHAALGLGAALCSAMAVFMSSFSHDMQLGMVFELYRNSAGYYADIEASIREALASPAEVRENGALFRERVAYQLGRFDDEDEDELVPTEAKAAGTLF